MTKRKSEFIKTKDQCAKRQAPLPVAGNFKQAFQDTKEITYSKSKTANEYAYDGNSRAQYNSQLEAVNVYRQNIDPLSANDDNRTQLEIGETGVQTNQKTRRIDFITKLPFAIVLNILEELFTVDIFMMTTVPKSWRDQLIKYPTLWKEIILDDNTMEQCKDALPMVFPHIVKYIERLFICFLNKQQFHTIMDIIAEYPPTQVKKLILRGKQSQFIVMEKREKKHIAERKQHFFTTV